MRNETLLDSGLAASRIHNYDAYLGEYGINPEWDLRYYNLADPIVRQSALQDAMAIPASSDHKERAMMLPEKLRNDEAYHMLLTYGIEGYLDLDMSLIQEEYEAIKEVLSVYYNPLKLGYIDYRDGMQLLEKKLKEAGNGKVKEEIHRQILEFMKSQ